MTLYYMTNVSWWQFKKVGDNLKKLNPHFNKMYGQQTWQDGELEERLLPTKSCYILITWSCEVM